MVGASRVISGWGGWPTQEAGMLEPRSPEACRIECQNNDVLIARGMGRSYGDSANAATVLQTTYLDHFIAFDPRSGLLTVQAGVTLREILELTVKQGWFLPVTPGTSFVTVGGAVASDVHGKNHHFAGTFTQHVVSLEILLGSGEIVTTSPTELPDLFHATCGGMGLTGVIIATTIQLIRIHSDSIAFTTIKANSLEDACEAFNIHHGATYSVAWIDCLATGKNLGRSVIMVGEHIDSGGTEFAPKSSFAVPIHTPAALLNSMTMRAFNYAYWARASHNQTQISSLHSFFYPLDAVGGWNKLYGKAGFLQYQFVLPSEGGVANLRTVLTKIVQSGAGSFLAVLKKFGAANQNMLSFPLEGYTLALDFKMTGSVITLLHELDSLVIGMGGRVYLAKDAIMEAQSFKKMYNQWEEFQAVRDRYGAIGRFNSAQSKRLGLE
jgi:decaprenylphospho-beta-D-ribofuranose 2-oxidase